MLAFVLVYIISVAAICVAELRLDGHAYPTGRARARLVALATFWPLCLVYVVARMALRRAARHLACAVARLIMAHPEAVAILRGDVDA